MGVKKRLLLRNLLILNVLLLSSIFWVSCDDDNANGKPILSFASEVDFNDSVSVSVQLADGFELELLAPGPLMANAVAISFDNQGAAHVSETHRRKSSDLDIRQHREWMTEGHRKHKSYPCLSCHFTNHYSNQHGKQK